MTWQKKARLAIGASSSCSSRSSRQRGAAEAPKTRPPSLPSGRGRHRLHQGRAWSYDHSKEGRIVFTIKFGSQATYPDGRTKFKNVELTCRTATGATFTVRAARRRSAGKNGQTVEDRALHGRGQATTSAASRSPPRPPTTRPTAFVKVPGAVAFQRGRMKGTGVGATYDRNREVLWLLDQAHITVAADAKAQGALEATSARRGDGAARALHAADRNGGAHHAEGRVIDADEITIQLTEDNERVQMLELRGNSRISGGQAAARRRCRRATSI